MERPLYSSPSHEYQLQAIPPPQKNGRAETQFIAQPIALLDNIAMTLTFTPREAKEFIVGEIVAEADRENVMLSDIERKMLYFSETAWSLPDIYEVNEAFKQSYDSGEYEAKIASLINNAVHRLREHDTRSLKAWKQAVRTLNQEDHYLSVLIGIADGSLHLSTQSSGFGVLQFLQVLLIIFGGAVTLLIAIAMYLRLTGQV